MTASKPKVLLLGDIEYPKARAEVETFADPIDFNSQDRDSFIKECRSGAFGNAAAAYHTVPSGKRTGNIDGEVVAALKDAGIKFFAHNGAGYDQINTKDCTAAGIRVSNTPGVVDDATADAAIFLLLGALRGFNEGMVNLRKGEFRGKKPVGQGHDPEGKTLGIIGMGGIGRQVRDKAQAFSMKVIYSNRKRLPSNLEGKADYVSFEELLKTSDAISLNLPLSPATKHTIGAKEFQQMKDGVIIVNTARGPVMDEGALVDALRSGKVGSAGLDVYEEEPKVHPGLSNDSHVILLPHMGTHTFETQEKMELHVVANIRSALEDGKLISIVPEQKDM